jgi:hypothetical protein
VSRRSLTKFSRVAWCGTRVGGVAKISADGLSDVDSIQARGNAPTTSRKAAAA